MDQFLSVERDKHHGGMERPEDIKLNADQVFIYVGAHNL